MLYNPSIAWGTTRTLLAAVASFGGGEPRVSFLQVLAFLSCNELGDRFSRLVVINCHWVVVSPKSVLYDLEDDWNEA